MPGVRTLAVATGLLDADQADELLSLAPEGDDAAVQLVAVSESGAVVGAAWCVREAVSDGVWNLQLLATEPALQGGGIGSSLMMHLEALLQSDSAPSGSAILIETSSAAGFERIRAFYARRGYVQVGQIPNYYGPRDDKVIFWKSLAG
jgi:ribosomal protein S18 acetylase RimI-like enzyme